MTDATRPAPILTDDNSFFWDAATKRRLVAQRCGSCKRLRHPPRPMCPGCGSVDVDVVDLAGHGTVYSYSVLHHPQNPLFDYPVVAALVDLDEGIRMASNLINVSPGAIEIGMPVTVAFAATAGGGLVPVFEPAGPADAADAAVIAEPAGVPR
jgi:uncharacterized OB-fold protein